MHVEGQIFNDKKRKDRKMVGKDTNEDKIVYHHSEINREEESDSDCDHNKRYDEDTDT